MHVVGENLVLVQREETFFVMFHNTFFMCSIKHLQAYKAKFLLK